MDSCTPLTDEDCQLLQALFDIGPDAAAQLREFAAAWAADHPDPPGVFALALLLVQWAWAATGGHPADVRVFGGAQSADSVFADVTVDDAPLFDSVRAWVAVHVLGRDPDLPLWQAAALSDLVRAAQLAVARGARFTTDVPMVLLQLRRPLRGITGLDLLPVSDLLAASPLSPQDTLSLLLLHDKPREVPDPRAVERANRAAASAAAASAGEEAEPPSADVCGVDDALREEPRCVGALDAMMGLPVEGPRAWCVRGMCLDDSTLRGMAAMSVANPLRSTRVSDSEWADIRSVFWG